MNTDLRTVRAFFLAVLVAVSLLGAACANSETPELTGEQANDPELVTGRDIYQADCARCHGGSGGGGSGPKLSGGRVSERFPDPADAEAVVRDGRGSMPSWDKKLSAEEITAVVRYAREVL